MKAILVIDVDDCINVGPCKADVYVRFPFQSNGWVREYKNVPLKPMPEPRCETIGEDIADHEAHGWNLCLEELEK